MKENTMPSRPVSYPAPGYKTMLARLFGHQRLLDAVTSDKIDVLRDHYRELARVIDVMLPTGAEKTLAIRDLHNSLLRAEEIIRNGD